MRYYFKSLNNKEILKLLKTAIILFSALCEFAEPKFEFQTHLKSN